MVSLAVDHREKKKKEKWKTKGKKKKKDRKKEQLLVNWHQTSFGKVLKWSLPLSYPAQTDHIRFLVHRNESLYFASLRCFKYSSGRPQKQIMEASRLDSNPNQTKQCRTTSKEELVLGRQKNSFVESKMIPENYWGRKIAENKAQCLTQTARRGGSKYLILLIRKRRTAGTKARIATKNDSQ